MVGRVARDVQRADGETAHLQLGAVGERNVRRHGGALEGRDLRSRLGHQRLVPVHVIVVPVGVQDVRDAKSLGLGALLHEPRIEGRVDGDRHPLPSIPHEVGEVAVSSDSQLLEYQIHGILHILHAGIGLLCAQATGPATPGWRGSGVQHPRCPVSPASSPRCTARSSFADGGSS